MITIKPEHFYLFIRNVDKGLNENKKVLQYVSNQVIKMKGIHLINACNKLALLYNNNHFTMKEFCLHILNMLLNDVEEFLYLPSKWDIENIAKISKVFSEEQLVKDQNFIIQVAQKTGVDSIEKYFNINSNGESIAIDFLKKGYISPLFILRYKSKFNVEFPETEAHKRARNIIDVMEQVIESKVIK